MDPIRTAVVIVAGGTGSRAGTRIPKQYVALGGETLLRHTVRVFTSHPDIDAVLVVIGASDRSRYDEAVRNLPNLLPPTIGGPERQASVRAGIEALAEHAPDKVLIHDGARPFVRHETISAVLDALETSSGAVAATPLSDTLKRQNSAGGIEETMPRDGLWRAATPQGFRYETIRDAHRHAKPGATDDAMLLEWEGLHVTLVPDGMTNFKLTYKEDFALAEKLLAAERETRTGNGFDVHAFESGESVTLCGIVIPHDQSLKGHSDADVGLHALTDALLGAIGEGDIGQHFPPSDPQWRGAPSHQFLEHAAGLLRARGGRIVNLDLTLVCEAPKIGPHRPAMRARIAEILAIAEDRVSVKATTTEKLGFTGRREGIAAQATVSVELPRSYA